MLCYKDYKDSCIRIGFSALGQGGYETTLLGLGTSKICLADKNSKTIPVYECEIAKENYMLNSIVYLNFFFIYRILLCTQDTLQW